MVGRWLLLRNFCFLKKLIEVRMLTTFYIAKNDHRWVTFISLKTITLANGRRGTTTGTPGLLPQEIRGRGPSSTARARARGSSAGARAPAGIARQGDFAHFLHIFGALVLGCIETKFCEQICVWQHFSRSTRCAHFCTAAISKF